MKVREIQLFPHAFPVVQILQHATRGAAVTVRGATVGARVGARVGATVGCRVATTVVGATCAGAGAIVGESGSVAGAGEQAIVPSASAIMRIE